MIFFAKSCTNGHSEEWANFSAKIVVIFISVGSNLVRFEGSFGFLRFGRFEVRFLGPN